MSASLGCNRCLHGTKIGALGQECRGEKQTGKSSSGCKHVIMRSAEASAFPRLGLTSLSKERLCIGFEVDDRNLGGVSLGSV